MINKEISTEVMLAPEEELLAMLRQNTPIEEGYTRIALPRLGYYSQDKTEGKGKALKVVAEAGVFYTEVKAGEEYLKEEIGTEIEMTVVYSRKKLTYYDSQTEEFTSSSLYDNDNDVVTLFKAGKVLSKDTPENLRKLKEYEKMGDDGKMKCKLEINRVLYVIYNGNPYEMTIRGSSMYSFSTYSKSLLVTSVLTSVTSTAEKKGTIEWNKLAFSSARPLTIDELREVVAMQTQIKEGIAQEKEYFAKLAERTAPLQVGESLENVVAELNAPTGFE